MSAEPRWYRRKPDRVQLVELPHNLEEFEFPEGIQVRRIEGSGIFLFLNPDDGQWHRALPGRFLRVDLLPDEVYQLSRDYVEQRFELEPEPEPAP